MKRARMRGFTLVEVMVTLAVLAIGILGIAMYTAVGLRTGAENNVRATALQVASQAVEPLNAAARGGAATFRNALVGMFPAPGYSRTIAANNGEVFTVSVPLDGAGNPRANDDAAVPVNWFTNIGLPPATVTVVTQVSYTRVDGTQQNTTTTHTFLIN